MAEATAPALILTASR